MLPREPKPSVECELHWRNVRWNEIDPLLPPE